MTRTTPRDPTPKEKAEARFRQRMASHVVPAEIAADPEKLAAYKAGFVAAYGDALVDGVRIGLDLRSSAGGFVMQGSEDEIQA